MAKIVIDKILGRPLLHDHWSSVPATASSTGRAGEKAYDSDYLYVAVDANTWKRTALSTWASAAEYLLMETGDFLLNEDGDQFILE